MWPARNLPRAPDFASSNSLLNMRYRILEFNSYLAHLKAPFCLSLPQPSNCEIASTFKFLLEHLDYPISEKGFEEDLLSFLPIVGCYININKSDLSEPSAPHIWVKIFDVLEWLAELARESDRLSECHSTSDDFLQYVTQRYLSGDDDAREEHKERYASLVRVRSDILAEQAEEMEKIIADLEAKLAARISGPSFREELEKKKGLLIENEKKFEAVAESWRRKHREMMERGNGLGKVLEVKNKKYKRLSEEKAELEKRKKKREEESIALQKQLQDKSKVCEEKKKLLTALQDKLDEIDGRLRLLKNEVEEHRATCAAETKKMTDYLAEEENRLSSVENEARENLKVIII